MTVLVGAALEPPRADGRSAAGFDIAPDGQSFVTMKDTEMATGSLELIVNWFEELKRRVPTEWRLSTQAGAVQRVENGGYVASPSKAAKTFKNALRSQTRPAAPVPPGALTHGTAPPGHRSHTDS